MTGPSWGMLPEAVEKLVGRVIEPAAYYGAEVWQCVAYNERKLAPLNVTVSPSDLRREGKLATSYDLSVALFVATSSEIFSGHSLAWRPFFLHL